MFELSVNAQLINLVTAFVLGFGWTCGCWLAGKILAVLFAPRE